MIRTHIWSEWVSVWVPVKALASPSPIWKPTLPPWRKSNCQLRRWLKAYVHQAMMPVFRVLAIQVETCFPSCLWSRTEPLTNGYNTESILGWQMPSNPWARRWKQASHSLGLFWLSWSWTIGMGLCPVKGWLRCFSASSSNQKLRWHSLVSNVVSLLNSKLFEWWKSTCHAHSHAFTLGLKQKHTGGFCVWPMGPSGASFLVEYGRCQWWWCGRMATWTL